MIAQLVSNWIAVVVYALGSVLFIVGLVFGKEGASRWAFRAALAGLVPHTVGLGLRWAQTGHGPYLNLYEVASANSWFGVVIYLLATLRFKRIKVAGAVVLPVAFVVFGAGMLASPEVKRVVPALLSTWLVLHVLFAKLTYGSYLVGTAVAFLHLVKARKGDGSAMMKRLPSLEIMDDLLHKFVLMGFVTHTLMITSGAVWAKKAFGRYWGWDPIETWSLVSWICYGVLLHLRILHGWRGVRLAWVAVVCLVVLFVAFFALPNLIGSSHNMALD